MSSPTPFQDVDRSPPTSDAAIKPLKRKVIVTSPLAQHLRIASLASRLHHQRCSNLMVLMLLLSRLFVTGKGWKIDEEGKEVLKHKRLQDM